METEAFRLTLDPRIVPAKKRVDKLQLAPGDQIAYVGKVEINGEVSQGVDLFTVTNSLGYVTVEEASDTEIVFMQHHLVNSMEELAENFIDVISDQATKALWTALVNEFSIPHWEVDHILTHFKSAIRHSIWEEMGSPELIHKKPKWWRRVYLSVKRHMKKREKDESRNRED